MPGSAGERLALVGAADQQADDAFAGSSPRGSIDQEFAGRGGLFGRFEDHRIAGDQRRDDVAVGQVRREIVGAEHREHAMRLVANRDLVAHRRFELPLRRPLGIGLDRDFDLVDDRADFGLGFPIRLAGFARDELGELVLALAHDIGEAAHGLDPVGERMGGPVRPGGARRGDFGGGIADLRPTRLSRRSPDRSRSAFGHGRRAPRPRSFNLPVHPAHRFAHSADRSNLVVEGLPVVALGNRRPDRFDLVDVHRAGRGVATNMGAMARARPSSASASARKASDG